MTAAMDRGAGFAELLARFRAGGRASPAIVMGIVNATPDSFSDGGLFAAPAEAVEHALRLIRDGAEIIDVGGESTRAGAAPVAEAEELRRVIPVIEGLASSSTALVSVDTMKAAVAEAALRAGAAVVNDVRGLQGDPQLAHVAARYGAGVIAMHNPGLLGSAKPLAGDPVETCLAFFARSLEIARNAGIREDRLVLDPGLGFGKSLEQNLALIARIPELLALGFPILAGASRKSFIGKVTGREFPDRLIGTLAANVAAALGGAAIVRVHDVAEHVEAMRMTAAIRGAAAGRSSRLTFAVLGLGGNIGDPRSLMAAALDRLAGHPQINLKAVSALYRTPPWGKTDQPAFLNAAARIDTNLTPRELLEAVLDAERELGRHRGERWGPRTIDIDILIYGAEEIAEPGLHVPHARLTERAFALAPLVDVAPEAGFGGRRALEWLALADESGIERVQGPDWYKPVNPHI